jgi:hypothetical protein
MSEISSTPSPSLIICIDALPQASDIVSNLLRQLQLFGLFTAHFRALRPEEDKSFLDRLGLRPGLLDSILQASDLAFSGSVLIRNVPAISNRARWTRPGELGGYAGIDIDTTARDLLASYLGCWQHAVQYPKSVPFRFLRLTVWYWRKVDNVLRALGLLLDLYAAGYILTQETVTSVFLSVAFAYVAGFESVALRDLDFSDEKTDQLLSDAIESVAECPARADRAQILVEWLLERALSESEAARQSECLDDWRIRIAKMQPTMEVLHSCDLKYNDHLLGFQRAMASQFEEVRADLFGNVLAVRIIASSGRPLLERLLGVAAVGIGYQRRFDGDWLRSMLEDRVLAPNALYKTIAGVYEGLTLPAAPDIDLPLAWRTVSPAISWPLHAAFERDQMLERSTEYDPKDVRSTCGELGLKANGGEPEHSDADEAAARRALSLRELSAFFRSKSLFDHEDPRHAIPELEQFAAVFPYNHIIERELGIRYDQSGNVEAGHRHMRAALLLEPTDAMNWRSLGVVLRRTGHVSDAVFCGGVSRMIEQRREN